jgi:uncharacterized protein (DUF488 family)
MTPVDLFTVGHSNRSIEQFLALLDAHGIKHVVDVRTAAGSRRHPQFMREALAHSLPEHGIAYTHLPALGGFRKPRPDTINTAWRNESFRGFADYMQTADFEAAMNRLLEIAQSQPTAVMCAEAVPWRCHRSLIGDAAVARGLTVADIVSPSRAAPHALTSFAHVEEGHVTYPGEA